MENSAIDRITKIMLHATNGASEAQFDLGKAYYSGDGLSKDLEQAAHWFLEAAKQNHPSAQYCLGFCYEHGEGVPKDFEQAVYWYRKSAEQGYVCSQCALGDMYRGGRGVELDHCVFHMM